MHAPSIEAPRSCALEYRRAHLSAFCAITAAGLSVAAGAIFAAAGARRPWLGGAAAAVLWAIPALAWRPVLERGVWLWNGVTRRLAGVLRRYTVTVTYFVMIAPLAVCGSPLRESLAKTPGSGWRRRTDAWSVDPAGLRAFAAQAGRGWALCLLPTMVLLSLLREDSDEAAPPASTYTLY